VTVTTSDRTRTDGTFAFSNVAPGDFVLAAMADSMLWGQADIQAAGQDIDDIVIRLQPPLVVRGRAVNASGEAMPDAPARFQLFLTRIASGSMWLGGPIVNPDGTFVFPGVLPGLYRLSASDPRGQNVFLQSATREGKDIIDAPFEIHANDTNTDIVVTFSSSQSELTGVGSDRSGQPVSQYYLLVFSDEPQFWTLGSRRVKAVRTDVNGKYSVAGLPPGNYHLCALTEFDKQRQDDASYLEQFIGRSIAISLGDGEKKTQDLRIGG
jgi:hypothetical protein